MAPLRAFSHSVLATDDAVLVGTLPRMPGGDDEPGQLGPVPDPLDRVWSHPSELPPKPRPRRRRRDWLVAAAAGTAGALVTVAALATLGLLGDDDGSRVATPGSTAPAELVAELAAAAAPSVVIVDAATADGTRRGSGVCVRRTGDEDSSAHSTEIVTSNALVASASEITVVSADGSTQTARYVGGDAPTDVALLRIGAHLPSLTIDRGNVPEVGHTVVAIGGAASGETAPWVASGVVSARDVVVEASTGVHPGVIEVDTTMGARAAGGALLDRDGHMVGLIIGGATRGFPESAATPADIVAEVVDQLRHSGHMTRGWIGLAGHDTGDTVTVVGVAADSPAADVGIEPGDVIAAVDGDPIESGAELAAEVARHPPGTRVVLTIEHGATTDDVTVLLGSAQS